VADSVGGERTVAVAFSGGLDSSILAKCASRRAKVVACTGSSQGSIDAAKAGEAASALNVELVTTELTKDKVAEALATMDLPFEPTLMDRGLWCLYSLVSKSAGKTGAKVILLGQLADELFGGYAKYVEALRLGGDDAAASMMSEDVLEYSHRGRVRDVAACGRWVEPRFPFEARDVVDLASNLPMQYKIRDGVRKAVLRRAALLLNVPEGMAGATKKAAQYSSGVQKLLAGSCF
jgi:asparagine synthase (glutamine-hydrolysing)